jgi:hypothetical protein
MDKHEHGIKPDWKHKEAEKKGHSYEKRDDHKQYPDKKGVIAPEIKRGMDEHK